MNGTAWHPLCLFSSNTQGGLMFVIASALVGIVGIFYVRRRFGRKKQFSGPAA